MDTPTGTKEAPIGVLCLLFLQVFAEQLDLELNLDRLHQAFSFLTNLILEARLQKSMRLAYRAGPPFRYEVLTSVLRKLSSGKEPAVIGLSTDEVVLSPHAWGRIESALRKESPHIKIELQAYLPLCRKAAQYYKSQTRFFTSCD